MKKINKYELVNYFIIISNYFIIINYMIDYLKKYLKYKKKYLKTKKKLYGGGPFVKITSDLFTTLYKFEGPQSCGTCVLNQLGFPEDIIDYLYQNTNYGEIGVDTGILLRLIINLEEFLWENKYYNEQKHSEDKYEPTKLEIIKVDNEKMDELVEKIFELDNGYARIICWMKTSAAKAFLENVKNVENTTGEEKRDRQEEDDEQNRNKPKLRPIGHYVIAAKDDKSNKHIIDPQNNKIISDYANTNNANTNNVNIIKYFKSNEIMYVYLYTNGIYVTSQTIATITHQNSKYVVTERPQYERIDTQIKKHIEEVKKWMEEYNKKHT
jgi:ribosomal protein L9